MAQTQKQHKSGIVRFKAGEVLFNQNDPADSLYIIQKGQIRLYIPKGQGFVEIAILRAGEVIGEMAYFDEKGSRRSCSAAAIVPTDVVRVTFAAFDKTMQGLNPWFKTIVNTLADRLRKTNDRVKQLETNSVGFGKDGKVGEYVFFHTTDVLRILAGIYLSSKVHAQKGEDGAHRIHMNSIRYYLFDIFGVAEIKFEEMIELLKREGIIVMEADKDGQEKLVKIPDLDSLRLIVAYVNGEKVKTDDKKTKTTRKCNMILSRMKAQLLAKNVTSGKASVNLSAIIDELKEGQAIVNSGDLKPAIVSGIVEDILVDDQGNMTNMVNVDSLFKMLPGLVFQDAWQRINEEKSGNSY
ncbi:Crp/Fnr family transcriptional regulator [Halobacteriovorax sp. YZS-1-1]|uniref:Crp/Fnr family transcriptional regulator n=1 Tax=unclassified Halobacteriovorax TaxID=2639665 RepID=UPI003999B489